MERPFPAYNGDDPYIFVSYAHEDTELVFREIKWLKDQGFNIWYDEGISPGSTWREELASAITDCDLFVLFVTPSSAISNNCLKEVNYALEEDSAILAVHLKSTNLSQGLRLSLSDRQAILKHELTDGEYKEKVLSGVRSHIQQSQSVGPVAPAPAAGSSARSVLIGTGLIALAILAVGILLYMKPGEEVADTTGSPLSLEQQGPATGVATTVPAVIEAKPSIAVLPFVDMSQNQDQEYFSDGISEEILNGLTQNPGLKVIARSSAFSFKGRNVDVREIGEILGVGHIVEGSVRKSGNRVRVSAQLIDTSDGSQVWSDRYDRELNDIFAVQDDISQAILTALDIHLLPRAEGVAVRAAVNINAYNAFLQGRYYFNKGVNIGVSDSLDKAVGYFEEAIAFDPEYADAYGWLSRMHNLYVWGNFDSAANRLPIVEDYIDKALILDPNQVEALATRANNLFFVKREYQEAMDDMAALVETYPSNTALLSLYRTQFLAIGRYDLHLAVMERIVLLDPREPFALFQRAGAAVMFAQYEEAIEWLLKVEELGVDQSSFVLRGAYQLGDEELVKKRLERLKDLYGAKSQPYLMMSAFLQAQEGDFEAARETLKPIREADAGYRSYSVKTAIARLEGRTEKALELYRQALKANEYPALWTLQGWPEVRQTWPEFYSSQKYQTVRRENGLDDESIAKLKIAPLPF